MRLLQKVGMLIVAVVMLSAIAVNAAAPELTVLLPSYSAIAAGADFDALCENPQSAAFFAMLEESGGKSAKELSELIVACDAGGKRRTLIAEFDSDEKVGALCRKVADKRLSAEDHENFRIYLLKGRVSEYKAVRMVQMTDRTLGIFTAFPAQEKFQVKSGKSLIDTLAPRRSGILLWGRGKPQIQRKYLDTIREFSFAMEEDVNKKLTFHGYIRFAKPRHALAFKMVMKKAIQSFMYKKYGVSYRDTAKALDALDITCRGTDIRFSGNDLGPIFTVLHRVLKQPLASLREIAE